MSDKAGKYRINNYPFFTGSLGNWAGNERRIPTYTLELPNSDWTKTKKFYNTFRTAIHHAIDHDLKSDLKPKKKVSKKDQIINSLEQAALAELRKKKIGKESRAVTALPEEVGIGTSIMINAAASDKEDQGTSEKAVSSLKPPSCVVSL